MPPYPPPQPSLSNVYGGYDDPGDLDWTVDVAIPDLPEGATTIELYYELTESDDWIYVNNFTSGGGSYTITGLTDNTMYDVKWRAINDSPYYMDGELITFTSAPDLPPQITDLPNSNVTWTTVTATSPSSLPAGALSLNMETQQYPAAWEDNQVDVALDEPITGTGLDPGITSYVRWSAIGTAMTTPYSLGSESYSQLTVFETHAYLPAPALSNVGMTMATVTAPDSWPTHTGMVGLQIMENGVLGPTVEGDVSPGQVMPIIGLDPTQTYVVFYSCGITYVTDGPGSTIPLMTPGPGVPGCAPM